MCDDPDLEKYLWVTIPLNRNTSRVFQASNELTQFLSSNLHSPGECNADNRFLLKAHFPVFQHEPLEETSKEYLDWWRKFDRVLWVQRNPFDAIFSLWNMMEMLESFQRGDNLVGSA